MRQYVCSTGVCRAIWLSSVTTDHACARSYSPYRCNRATHRGIRTEDREEHKEGIEKDECLGSPSASNPIRCPAPATFPSVTYDLSLVSRFANIGIFEPGARFVCDSLRSSRSSVQILVLHSPLRSCIISQPDMESKHPIIATGRLK